LYFFSCKDFLNSKYFEESAWRGYLTARLLSLKIKGVWLYLIVGGGVVLVALALLLLFCKTRTAICGIPLRKGYFLYHGIGVLHLVDGDIY
jgi:CAAX amino terminal protease family protein